MLSRPKGQALSGEHAGEKVQFGGGQHKAHKRSQHCWTGPCSCPSAQRKDPSQAVRQELQSRSAWPAKSHLQGKKTVAQGLVAGWS